MRAQETIFITTSCIRPAETVFFRARQALPGLAVGCKLFVRARWDKSGLPMCLWTVFVQARQDEPDLSVDYKLSSYKPDETSQVYL